MGAVHAVSQLKKKIIIIKDNNKKNPHTHILQANQMVNMFYLKINFCKLKK